MDLPHADLLPEELDSAVKELRREADSALAHKADILGSGTVELGSPIDWHRDYKSGYRWPEAFYQDIEVTRLDDDSDAKMPWELSRCHHLLTLARAAVVFRDERCAQELEDQLAAWIDDNPPGVGINWTTPMEIALRAVNWIWAIGTLEQRRSLGPSLRERVAQSLGAHARHIERNLEGTPWVRSNHYMADIVGLLAIAWALPDDPGSRRWRKHARRALEREIVEQVRDDGVDFEASLPYHGLVTEMLILAAWIARQAGEPLSARFDRRLESMLEASRALRHPSGRIPQFGDCDSGRVLPAGSQRPPTHDHLIWLGAALFETGKPLDELPHPEVAWTLGIPHWERLSMESVCAPPARRSFPDSGYWVIADRLAHLVVRAGDVGQNGNGGHAHNDTLSFELSLGGVPLIVDSGAYLYTSNIELRNRFRSTAAHNTIRIDGREINPIAPREAFRLRQHASVSLRESTDCTLVLSHDGYRDAAPGVLHRRTFALTEPGAVSIVDELEGSGEHLIESFLHLSPGTDVTPLSDNRFRVKCRDLDAQIGCFGKLPLGATVVQDWVSDRYGVREEAPVIVSTVQAAAPVTLNWEITVALASQLPPVQEWVT